MSWFRLGVVMIGFVCLFRDMAKWMGHDDQSRIGWVIFECIVLAGLLTFPG